MLSQEESAYLRLFPSFIQFRVPTQKMVPPTRHLSTQLAPTFSASNLNVDSPLQVCLEACFISDLTIHTNHHTYPLGEARQGHRKGSGSSFIHPKHTAAYRVFCPSGSIIPLPGTLTCIRPASHCLQSILKARLLLHCALNFGEPKEPSRLSGNRP